MAFDPKVCFISYRSDHYEHAKKLQAFLQPKIKERILIPPSQLAIVNELRTALGYFELISTLEPQISRADAFIVLNTPDYRDGYWTRIEVDIWCLKHKHIALFGINEDGEPYFEDIKKVGVWFFDRAFLRYRLWVTRDTDRHGLVGSLAKSCLMVPCVHCGTSLLVTPAYANKSLTGGIACAYCSGTLTIKVVSGRYTLAGKFPPLDHDTLIGLMAGKYHFEKSSDGKECVIMHYHKKSLPLFRMPDEKLDT